MFAAALDLQMLLYIVYNNHKDIILYLLCITILNMNMYVLISIKATKMLKPLKCL